jgi:WD40 repeat protein/serine/threonine protein kinase/DNA-binding XRE family transcriptional regulator
MMDAGITFGQVVRERRGALGLTQTELARRANCAAITIRKIEADALRPSVQMAELIALALTIPEEEQLAFVRLARKEKDPSPIPTPSPSMGEIGLPDLSGRAVKGFELGEMIGSGGYGVVYRALQSSVGRDVAVKIILPRYANHPDFIRRFEAEAQLIARLEHPHIVPLYDYWREPDAAYLIMRLLRGGSLANQLQQGAIPIELVYQYTHQLGLALDVAHRNGVIHRDIKPANVLIDEEANAYLADFGIARNIEWEDGQTLADDATSIVSPAYVSPEQILHEPVKLQSDVYLLGILLFEMLTGHKPFSGPTPIAFIQQHLEEELPSIHRYDRQLPSGLDEVIQIAAAKNVADRYRDVPSFLHAFRQALLSQSDLITVLSPWEKQLELTSEELAELENPYVGLRAFSESDAGHFHGRETLIQEVFSRLSDDTELARFLAIVGPSGGGKSSVARAGLVPALRRGALPNSENWFILDFTPGAHPWEEIEAALLRVAVNPPETLLNQLQEGDRGLLRAVHRILPDDGNTELLLIVDQFEEIFTLVENQAESQQFLNSIVTAVLDPRSRLRVVVTLRADFYDRPLQYVDFGDMLRQRTVSILPMTPDELEQAINQPAAQCGIRLEPGLAATIIRDVGDQPGTLPLLQYLLTELFERRDNGFMTMAAYQAVGGVSGALARRADQLYEALNTNEREAARQLFLRLITLGEGVEDTRRRVRLSELGDLIMREEGMVTLPDGYLDEVLNLYGQYRLLTFDRDPITREPTVEVAHEALLREWGRLRGWLDKSRADIRIQRQLTRATTDWEESGRDSSFLIPGGTRLALFTSWRDQADLSVTQVEEDYLQASMLADREQQEHEAQQTRTRQKLQRGLVGVLVAGLIIAVGLAVYAFRQQRMADEQRQEALRQSSIGLAALAEEAMMGENQDLGVLLALEAVEHYPFTPQAAGALAQSVDEFRPFRLLDPRDSVADLIAVASWSPDGTRIAAASSPSPNSVIIWDAENGSELLAVNTHGSLCQETYNLMNDLAWSPSGDRLAVVAQDSGSLDGCGLVVIDSESGETLMTQRSDKSAARSLDWSADESIILSGHEDGSLRMWDAETGAEIRAVDGYDTAVYDARFSPDGRFIASASDDGIIRIWDAATSAEEMALTGHAGAVRSVAWSPGGDRLISGGADGLPRVWDVSSGETLMSLPGHTEEVVIVTWSEDGTRLATQGMDAIVKVWDAASGGLLFDIPNAAPEPATKRGYVEFSPDGNWILTGSSRVLGPRMWDTSLPAPKLFGHTFGQEWGAWSPDGKFIATSGEDGSARLWDAETGQQLREFEDGSYWSDWSPDGSQLVTAHGIAAYSLDIWDVATGEKTASLTVPEDEYGAPQFLTMDWSPNGSYILAAAFRPSRPQPIYVWDAETGELISALEADDVCMLGWPRWSPDSSRIAGGCIFVPPDMNAPARVWDVESGEQLHTFESEYGWTYRTVWSTDGAQLLVTYENGVAQIRDAESGDVLLTFSEHQGPVGGEWSPDGSLILSTDYATREVKIWNSQTGEELFSFSVAGAPLTVGWSPEGRQIIVTGDGLNEPVIKRIWHSAEELVAYAYECCVSRELTAEERAQFGLPERP